MTNEEAIKIIANYDVYGCGYCHQGGKEIKEAFEMAIKTLSGEPQEWISPTAEPLSTEEAKKLLYQEFKSKMKDGNPRLLVAYEIAMKALETQTEWISVKDGLPKPQKQVLVQYISGRMGVNHRWEGFYQGKMISEWNRCDSSVIAWMPLPSPYKGDE